MIGKYAVTHGSASVGTVEVTKEGLYYRIRCSCSLKDDEPYRLQLGMENLGVLVPEGGRFLLNTRRPIKQFDCQCPVFTVAGNDKNWHPVSADKPFLCLEALDSAVLQKRNDIPGILITSPAVNLQGNDQNP